MPRTTTQIKPKKAATLVNTNIEQEGEIEAFPKIKKVLEVEEPETVLGIDEKVDEDGSPLGDSEDELASEDATIDDEEVNPFGDKWEE